MGRYDFRPLRVHQTATQLLATERITSTPPWYNVIGQIPPSETLVRTQPLQHQETPKTQRPKTKKPSKLFQPMKVIYEEDSLRKQFFSDHPWELARPRIVLENDGKDAQRCDWSKMAQFHTPLSGESVIQRQLWLLRNERHMSRAQVYDRARKEFYELRLREEVRRHVAKEEALATGAYFGKSALEVGMELENQEYERWKAWTEKQLVLIEQRRAAGSTVTVAPVESELEGEEEVAEDPNISDTSPNLGPPKPEFHASA